MKRDTSSMGLLSELVLQGRVKNREDLRRVYRRLVKRLHPDTARAAAGGPSAGGAAPAPDRGAGPGRGFVDFDELRRELAEAEALLAEPAPVPEGAAAASRGEGESSPEGARAGPRPGGLHGRTERGAGAVDRELLLSELRDLIARGFPVQPRALARNKAYRAGVAALSAQLDLLSGTPATFARVDADMRVIRASSLSLIYHAMQVLWNGIDWGLTGMAWCRQAALRDYALIEGELAERGLGELDGLLRWILELPPAGPTKGREGPRREP